MGKKINNTSGVLLLGYRKVIRWQKKITFHYKNSETVKNEGIFWLSYSDQRLSFRRSVDILVTFC